jgi:heterodisulfide reductase subunit B
VAAKEAGADCVALACPMCHVALDAYQPRIQRALETRLDLPVLYFTQLMGLALGVDRQRLGLKRHIVSPAPLLERLGF